jgi:hypothetical protein
MANASRDDIESQGPDAASADTCAGARQTAEAFSRLVDLDGDAFELLGRYERSLWRQFAHTLATLELIVSGSLTPPCTGRAESEDAH